MSWQPSTWIPQPHDVSARVGAAPTSSTSTPAATEPISAIDPQDLATDAGPISTVSDLGNLDFSTVENVGDVFTEAIPEQIGFLKTLGLDYGYGITSTIQWSLEHIHVYTGLPWWGSIIVTALASRIILFWPAVQGSDATARMGALKPITQPISERMMSAYKTQDTAVVQQAREEMRQVLKQANIKYSKMLVPAVCQGVIAFCALKLMRAMAALPVPGLRTGGALWFQDLTITDPTYLLPLIMAGTLHMFIRYGGETGAQVDMKPAMRNIMLYVMPVVVFASMAFFPSGVVLWLATTGLAGILQARFLQLPRVREFFGIAPLIEKPQDRNKARAPKVENIIDVASIRSNDATTPTGPVDVSKRLKYQAPKLKYSSPTNVKPSQQVETPPAVNTQVAPPTGNAVWSPKEFLTSRANDLGETWESLVGSVKEAAAKKTKRDTVPESRTMSKRQMEEAERYEREYQSRKKRQAKL